MNSDFYVTTNYLPCISKFRNLDRDIENNSKRWRKFVETEAPEKEKFPQVEIHIALDYCNTIFVFVLYRSYLFILCFCIVNEIGMEKERCSPKTLHDACIEAGSDDLRRSRIC